MNDRELSDRLLTARIEEETGKKISELSDSEIAPFVIKEMLQRKKIEYITDKDGKRKLSLRMR